MKVDLSLESAVSILLEWWNNWKRQALNEHNPPEYILEIIKVLEDKGLYFNLERGNFIR